MNMRWWVVLSVVAVVGVLSLPVLAQPYMGAGFGYGYMGARQQPVGQPLSIAQAETIARQALDQSGYAGLVPGEIMEFSNNFYVAVKYKVGGQGAFELLIDRYTGAVHPEPQSMMWNTQFGPMAGWSGLTHGAIGSRMMYRGGAGSMMGGGMGPGMMGQISAPSASPSVTLAQAKGLAQKFLDARLPGAKVDDATAFPGYYTLDFAQDGKVIGMLSVNAYTGQVWYHAWHGTFIEEKALD